MLPDMLIKILIGLAAVLLILIVVIATRPSDFRYSRSRAMDVTPAAAFARVNDFHQWNDWSPWAKVDPNCKNTFGGPASGTGATFAWDGNNEVGAGVMTIVESRPSELVRLNLEFKRPFESTCVTEITFVPNNGKTLVTWTMSGKNTFAGKAIGLFMDCEKMCGDMFSQGLANLEDVAKTK